MSTVATLNDRRMALRAELVELGHAREVMLLSAARRSAIVKQIISLRVELSDTDAGIAAAREKTE